MSGWQIVRLTVFSSRRSSVLVGATLTTSVTWVTTYRPWFPPLQDGYSSMSWRHLHSPVLVTTPKFPIRRHYCSSWGRHLLGCLITYVLYLDRFRLRHPWPCKTSSSIYSWIYNPFWVTRWSIRPGTFFMEPYCIDYLSSFLFSLFLPLVSPVEVPSNQLL